MMDNVIEVEVDGQIIEVDVEADLAINDITEDMDSIASLLGWYGNLLGAAKQRVENLDANYRAWRGRRVESILAQDPKLAEYKVNARINADQDFLTHKRGLAAANRVVIRIDRAWSALDRKASILQSKGALMRSELRATGMHTMDHEVDQGRRGPTVEERKAAVAGRTRNHSRRRTHSSED